MKLLFAIDEGDTSKSFSGCFKNSSYGHQIMTQVHHDWGWISLDHLESSNQGILCFGSWGICMCSQIVKFTHGGL